MIEFKSSEIRTWSRLGSCGAFGAAMIELAGQNENLAVLTADLCYYAGLDRFRQQYPENLLNCGIAEQNMIGIAAGMAKEGVSVFATTYATFASTRCCDQVKVNMGYMKLPIKLVGLTSGLSVGILGPTHMSLEDVSIMRSIPNITILSPADCTETVKAVMAAASHEGPVYIRLSGTMNSPIVYKEDYKFEIGKAIMLAEGNDIALVATGSMVATAVAVKDILAEIGIDVAVIDMHTIKPLDQEMIESCLDKSLIVTMEEHSIIGGLGSAVAEVLAQKRKRPVLQMIGIEDQYLHAADYEYLLKESGLTAENIAETIQRKYSEVKKYD